MSFINLTRKELYDKVWAGPLIKLARDYNLSDNGLRKICKKHSIPLPKAGHWAKVQHGHKTVQDKLFGDPDIKIQINTYKNRIVTAIESKKLSEPPKFYVEVPDEIHSFHPMTKTIKQRMKEQYKYYDGAYHFKHMRISKENWDRGVRIYDTALRALEKNFGKLDIDEEGVFVILKHKRMYIYLHEKIDAKDITPPLTEKQKDEIKKNPWRESYINPTKWEYIPTNIMTLSVEGGGDWTTISRRNYSDNNRHTLEEQIGDFLVAIQKLGEIEKRAAVIYARESCRQAREQKRQDQKRYETELKQQQLVKLEEQLKTWQHAEELRGFVRACMQRAAANPKSIKSFKEFNKWVKMALEYADTFDPLKTEFGI